MNEIEIFIKRMKKIGIQVELIGNYPWVYLDTINGIKVKGTFQANHGFTAFWVGSRVDQGIKISDITEVFKKIRETLKQ